MLPPVKDNPALHRFEIEVEGHTAFSVYERKPGVTTFIHTEVPAALGGKGVGSALAKGALDLTRARGDKIASRCAFISAYLQKHPEYQDLLA